MSLEQQDRFEIETWGATDVGLKRSLNEDVIVLDTENEVYLVADGMGGHAAGEVASKIATDEIVRAYEAGSNEADETWPEHWDSSLSAVANHIVDAIISGHHRQASIPFGAVQPDIALRGRRWSELSFR